MWCILPRHEEGPVRINTEAHPMRARLSLELALLAMLGWSLMSPRPALAQLPLPPDTTPPTVSLTSPGNGATVSGTTAVNATASDNVGVAGVQFLVDGVALGTADTAAPYTVSWNTTGASNGSHTLTATARDAAGDRATPSPVTGTVSEAAPPTTTRFEGSAPPLSPPRGGDRINRPGPRAP